MIIFTHDQDQLHTIGRKGVTPLFSYQEEVQQMLQMMSVEASRRINMAQFLFDRFLDEKFLFWYYKRIAINGSMGGIDRVSVEEFGRHLERVTSAPNSTAREKNPSGWKSNTRVDYQVIL